MNKWKASAETFFSNQHNRGHADRKTTTDFTIPLRAGFASALPLAKKVTKGKAAHSVTALDVGCSWGPIVFALASRPEVKDVAGIDTEDAAIEFGTSLRDDSFFEQCPKEKISFTKCGAEKMPYPDNSFDFITCNTVIEHVYDVEQSLVEMYRVLKPGGTLLVTAPNYLWPREPHLEIPMLPLGPKWLARQIARTMGKDAQFLDHLKFVTPGKIEAICEKHQIPYANTYLEKLHGILVEQNHQAIIGMKKAIPLLKSLNAIGANRVLYWLMKTSNFYPTLEYAITKPKQ